MIDINLYPKEKRKKKKGQLLAGGYNIPLEVVIGIGGAFFVFLFLVHGTLLFINISKVSRHKELKKQWEIIEPAKTNVENIIKELRSLQDKFKAVDRITTGSQVNWAQKLNGISSGLPRGIWLTRISFKNDVFFIEGSAISKTSNEMINVHSFTTNLKKDEYFLMYLDDLELGSIQRRKINTVEIADFLITAQLISEEEES